jgi:hypothetical protein
MGCRDDVDCDAKGWLSLVRSQPGSVLVRQPSVRLPWIGALLVASLLGSTWMSAADAHPKADRQASTQAWQRVHHADLDGDRRPDTIWFTLGKDFRVPSEELPSGRWTVHARISSTGATVSRTFQADGYGAITKRKWTPWAGATDLDHVGGQEIVLGAQGAADATLYRVLVYWNGSLRVLPSPPSPNTPDWVIIGAYLHGAGFRCTAHGVAATDYEPANNRATRWRLDRSSYIWSSDAWRLVSAKTRYVPSKSDHPPRAVGHYGGFICNGLPRGL